MFCPACGKDNSDGRKFCGSCGTNLEVVSRALYSKQTGLFTRAENALDQVIARYAERVFRNAPANLPSRRISDSWKILGEGILTLPVDFILFWLMLFVVLPVKLFTLVLTTPFKLLIQIGSRLKALPETGTGRIGQGRPELPSAQWDPASPISAVEHTTEHLSEYESRRRRRTTSD